MLQLQHAYALLHLFYVQNTPNVTDATGKRNTATTHSFIHKGVQTNFKRTKCWVYAHSNPV